MPNPVARAARPRRRRSGDASANLQFLTVGELEAVIDGIPNVSNGDRGVVHAVDGDGLYVRFDDAYRFLPREFDESTTRRGDPSVQHGYAITAYVAQRMTCRAAFVFARDDLYREWAYTALSRGRDRTGCTSSPSPAACEQRSLRARPRATHGACSSTRSDRSRPETMASELAQSQRRDSDRDIAR